jgi:hypothetical protein
MFKDGLAVGLTPSRRARGHLLTPTFDPKSEQMYEWADEPRTLAAIWSTGGQRKRSVELGEEVVSYFLPLSYYRVSFMPILEL